MSTRSSDSNIIQLWLTSQASPLTRSCYQRDIRRLMSHTHKPLIRIGLSDLQRFSQSLITSGLAPISRARTLAAVRSFFGFCVRLRYLPTNPAADLPLPRSENRLAERVLSEQEVRRLIIAPTRPDHRILLHLLYFAGLRVSEACNLKWRNLHKIGTSGQVTVFGKGGRTRAIALPSRLWRELSRRRGTAGPDDPVFRSRSGRPLDRGRVGKIVRLAAQQAGIPRPVSPHWLRHAHASHALDHGAPLHLVQATLGHSSIATTSGYLHARPSESSARYLSAA